jgi:hypothetical protein
MIWYILCSFDAFLTVLVSCIKKYLATLARRGRRIRWKINSRPRPSDEAEAGSWKKYFGTCKARPTKASSFAQDVKRGSVTERPSLGRVVLELRLNSTQFFRTFLSGSKVFLCSCNW